MNQIVIVCISIPYRVVILQLKGIFLFTKTHFHPKAGINNILLRANCLCQ